MSLFPPSGPIVGRRRRELPGGMVEMEASLQNKSKSKPLFCLLNITMLMPHIFNQMEAKIVCQFSSTFVPVLISSTKTKMKNVRRLSFFADEK